MFRECLNELISQKTNNLVSWLRAKCGENVEWGKCWDNVDMSAVCLKTNITETTMWAECGENVEWRKCWENVDTSAVCLKTNITETRMWAECGENVEWRKCWENVDMSAVCLKINITETRMWAEHNMLRVGRMWGKRWVGRMLRGCRHEFMRSISYWQNVVSGDNVERMLIQVYSAQ